MNILLQSKTEVEKQFGEKATIATNLLGMVARGERAEGFLLGSLDAGFEVTVGFFNDLARYAAFKKRSGTDWVESDARAILMQIGSFANWSSKPGSNFFDYREKKGTKVVAEATGWQTPERKYLFAYVPIVEGEIGIVPDKTAIDQKFGR